MTTLSPNTPIITKEAKQLRLLAIAHYVMAGLTGLLSLLPIMGIAIGAAMTVLIQGRTDPNAAEEGFAIILSSVLIMMLGITLTIYIICAANSLRKHRNYYLCRAVAAFICVIIPIGTILGIYTRKVLNQPSIKALFTADT